MGLSTSAASAFVGVRDFQSVEIEEELTVFCSQSKGDNLSW